MDSGQETVILEKMKAAFRNLPITMEQVLRGDFSSLFGEGQPKTQ